MANHSLPSVTSTYSNFVTELDDRLDDISKMFDVVSITNIPTGTIRWDSTLLTWRKWTGSEWQNLSSSYAINIDGSVGTNTPSTGSFTTLTTTGNVIIGGQLTVNGNITTVNSTTITVDDINIELGSVSNPTDITAAGGGITLRGTTDKTIAWTSSNGWTSSEDLNIAVGKTFKIAGTTVLSNNTLGSTITTSSLTTIGTISTGSWQASTIDTSWGGTGQTTYTSGQLLIGTSAGGLTKNTLTAGTGISITNGSGTITIATNLGTIATTSGGTGQTTYTDGQLLIGNTATGSINKTTLTAGTGISITNGNGTITITNSGVTTVNGSAGSVTVVGSITGTSNQITASASTGSVTLSLPQSIATSSNVQFNSLGIGTAASGTAGEIRAYNDITAYYNGSDIRIKENIKPLESVLDKLDSIGTYSFNYISRPSQKTIGVIAQELINHYPELVYETQPFESNSSLEKVYAVRYELLTVVLLQAIKELYSKFKGVS